MHTACATYAGTPFLFDRLIAACQQGSLTAESIPGYPNLNVRSTCMSPYGACNSTGTNTITSSLHRSDYVLSPVPSSYYFRLSTATFEYSSRCIRCIYVACRQLRPMHMLISHLMHGRAGAGACVSHGPKLDTSAGNKGR